MPFRSRAQRGLLYALHPEVAKRWEKETPKGKALPEHVRKRKPTGQQTIGSTKR